MTHYDSYYSDEDCQSVLSGRKYEKEENEEMLSASFGSGMGCEWNIFYSNEKKAFFGCISWWWVLCFGTFFIL